MRKLAVLETFKKLYMFGAHILGATPEEQNTMFLYVFIELLKAAVNKDYRIEQKDNDPYWFRYRVELVDYACTVELCVYTNILTYVVEQMYISVRGKDYERSICTNEDGLKKLLRFIVKYVNKHKRMCAYLILNGININDLLRGIS